MKNVLFICGSLVPGRDGVGDYTRRLAAELLITGHKVLIVATHDRGVSQIVREQQPGNNNVIDVIRIPVRARSGERLETLQEQLDTFNPDWVSLQYVPYSFNKYGIPFGFINSLGRLKNLQNLHVMFHELWVVPGDIKGIKGDFVATMQRRVVKRIGRQLKPSLVHTHLPSYATRLKELGVAALPLPLFANVSQTAPTASAENGTFNAVFFSKIFFPPSVVSFLRQLAEEKQHLNVSLLGGSKEKALKAAETLRAAIPGIEVDPVGFLSEEELSERLAVADLAVSPVPLHLLGKSGTVAAFFSHRLPVAAPRIVEQGEGFFLPALNQAVFSEYSPTAYELARTAARNLDTGIISAATISRNFAEDLEKRVLPPAL